VKVLILDTETTGLREDPNATTIEIAYALFDTTLMQVVNVLSYVMVHDENPKEHVNGISPQLLLAESGAVTPKTGFRTLRKNIDRWGVGAILAHNVAFDKFFIEKGFDQYELGPLDVTWVCTVRDIVYPSQTSSRKLSHLMVDHGLPVLGYHRAVSDVLMLCHLLQKVDNLSDQIRDAMQPLWTVEAIVGFDNKDLAKEAGFMWHPDTKRWLKSVRAESAQAATDRAKGEAIFPVKLVENVSV